MARKKLKLIYHIRRCHVCGSWNESENSFVNHCQHCGKYFPPYYFFEEKAIKAVPDNDLHWTKLKLQAGYHPLWGFSTYWDDTS